MLQIIDGYVTLAIKAQPGASRSAFAGKYGEEALKVRIAAPAVEGAANKELVKFLSKRFKVPKSSIEIVSGETSKIKRVRFPLTEKFTEWLEIFEEEA
jgi:uncharacterized protein (TIGR00251 family)